MGCIFPRPQAVRPPADWHASVREWDAAAGHAASFIWEKRLDCRPRAASGTSSRLSSLWTRPQRDKPVCSTIPVGRSRSKVPVLNKIDIGPSPRVRRVRSCRQPMAGAGSSIYELERSASMAPISRHAMNAVGMASTSSESVTIHIQYSVATDEPHPSPLCKAILARCSPLCGEVGLCLQGIPRTWRGRGSSRPSQAVHTARREMFGRDQCGRAKGKRSFARPASTCMCQSSIIRCWRSPVTLTPCLSWSPYRRRKSVAVLRRANFQGPPKRPSHRSRGGRPSGPRQTISPAGSVPLGSCSPSLLGGDMLVSGARRRQCARPFAGG